MFIWTCSRERTVRCTTKESNWKTSMYPPSGAMSELPLHKLMEKGNSKLIQRKEWKKSLFAHLKSFWIRWLIISASRSTLSIRLPNMSNWWLWVIKLSLKITRQSFHKNNIPFYLRYNQPIILLTHTSSSVPYLRQIQASPLAVNCTQVPWSSSEKFNSRLCQLTGKCWKATPANTIEGPSRSPRSTKRPKKRSNANTVSGASLTRKTTSSFTFATAKVTSGTYIMTVWPLGPQPRPQSRLQIMLRCTFWRRLSVKCA